MSRKDNPSRTDHDVIMVGAGISGINAAYRLHADLPDLNYTILESRRTFGGTWDLFTYPGIRSDSDLYTFGFPWRPWSGSNAIASAKAIQKYIRESAELYGIDKTIQYNTKVLAANWSDKTMDWTLEVETPEEKKFLTTKFLTWCTGYYNYKEPLPAKIPGLGNFKGQIIHPQFWPENLDYTNKKIAIIGSGATAVTLLPNLVPKASKVTMIQRSPAYVLPLPTGETKTGRIVRTFLPTWLADRITRLRYLLVSGLFFSFSQRFPSLARKFVKRETLKHLPKNVPFDPHFNPSYGVWIQRLCVAPDGDFYKALGNDHAEIVTDRIETVTKTGILTASGRIIDADIIITATGLQVQIAGGAAISINDVPMHPVEKFMWKGMMLQDVPNSSFMTGYTNASWTLGSDMTAIMICRLLRYMKEHGYKIVRPQVEKGVEMKPQSFTQLKSTYIEEARGRIPPAGDRGCWLPKKNYLWDYWRYKWESLTDGLVFDEGLEVDGKMNRGSKKGR